MRRLMLLGCLVFSGLTALVYEVIWTRLLGFVFGTTTEAIGTVLAIFFGGMAIGNLLAARRLARVERPLRLYAWLELGIGAFALASLPVLRHMDWIYAWFGTGHGTLTMTGLRIAGAALVLLPPTVAMGATLPVVARGLVERDGSLGRWSALLYAANTLGAVLGAYGCGFWLIPELGLTRSLVTAACLNVTVAGAVLALAGALVARPLETAEPDSLENDPQAPGAGRGWFLAFFGVSGFVAIGYEIVWSKVFTIVMEGTLYGFSTVLSAYLLGIGLGSLGVALFVDRIRDLPRAFGLLHVAIGASVALGTLAVPYLPFLHHQLAASGEDALHALFLLVAPLILLPTALFGAAFPILIRIYTRRAALVGEGMGLATAINTLGSISASLAVGFWWIPRIGIDATLYALLLLDLLIAFLVLARFQTSAGRERWAVTGVAAAVVLLVAGSFDGVRVEKAVVGRWIDTPTLGEYEVRLQEYSDATSLVLEGRSSIVTVHPEPFGKKLQTNGLPEAGFSYGPPYTSFVTLLLGALPYLTAESPERALVVGFGGGATVDALRRTALQEIEVVELEPEVLEAAKVLYEGRESPLDDPRVTVHVNDGRNHLLLRRYGDGPRYDVIASQPSHPWLLGAANLFTEDFFRLVRDDLTEGGSFALWVNGFRTDPESLLAVMTSFERVFPGSVVFEGSRLRPREALLLVGGRRPVRWKVDAMRGRLAEPGLAEAFALHEIESLESLLARCEGPTAIFAALDPTAANTDDNAFLETRIPRRLDWSVLDFDAIEARLPEDAPVLPPLEGTVDVASVVRTLLDFAPGSERWPYRRKVERLIAADGDGIDGLEREVFRGTAALRSEASEASEAALGQLRALARQHPSRPEPWRALGRHLALRVRAFDRAARAFAEAFARGEAPEDAYDAARAWHWVDARKSWEWMDRIPAKSRSRFPRLALFAAERALATRAQPDELRARRAGLEEYRDTPEGRRFPGVDATLARLAAELGDGAAARAYWDSDRRRREEQASPWLARARGALADGELEAAGSAIRELEQLLPGDARTLHLAARLHRARGDGRALEATFAAIEHWAPSLESGISTENRLRASLGLPLLPERPASALLRPRSLARSR